MASRQEISSLIDIAVEEQEAAIQEYRSPNIPLLDELGLSIIEQGAPVACDTTLAVTITKDSEDKIVNTEKSRNPPAIIGLFGGFATISVITDGAPIENGAEHVMEKRVAIFLNDSYDKTKFHLCPAESSALRQLSSDEADNQVMRRILEVVKAPTISIEGLVMATNFMRATNSERELYNAVLGAFVRPKDLFSVAIFDCYLQAQFSSNDYLAYSSQITENIDDKHRFILVAINDNGDDTATVTPQGINPDGKLNPLELMVMHEDFPGKLMPLSYIYGYVAAPKLKITNPYDADLRNPIC